MIAPLYRTLRYNIDYLHRRFDPKAKLLIFAYFGYASIYSTRKPFSVVKPNVQESLKFSDFEIGLIDTFFLGAVVVGHLIFPLIPQHGGTVSWQRSNLGPSSPPARDQSAIILALSYMICGISSALMALVGFSHSHILSELALYFLATTNGVATSFIFPIFVGSITSSISAKNRSTALCAWTTAQQTGSLVATVAAAWLAAHTNWEVAIGVLGLFCASVGGLIYLFSSILTLRLTPKEMGRVTSDADLALPCDSPPSARVIEIVDRRPDYEGEFSGEPGWLRTGKSAAGDWEEPSSRVASAVSTASTAYASDASPNTERLSVPSSDFNGPAAGAQSAPPVCCPHSPSPSLSDLATTPLPIAHGRATEKAGAREAPGAAGRHSEDGPAAARKGQVTRATEASAPLADRGEGAAGSAPTVTGGALGRGYDLTPAQLDAGERNRRPAKEEGIERRREDVVSPRGDAEMMFGCSFGEEAALPPASLSPSKSVVWQLPGLYCVSGCLFLVKAIRFAFLFWLPYYFMKVGHASVQEGGMISTAFDLGGYFGGVGAGLLADRLLAGRRALMAVAALLTASAVIELFALLAANAANRLQPFAALLAVGVAMAGADSIVGATLSSDLCNRAGLHSSNHFSNTASIVNAFGCSGAVVQGLLTPYFTTTIGWTGYFHFLALASVCAAAALAPVCMHESAYLRNNLNRNPVVPVT